jgi:hypothetical protein
LLAKSFNASPLILLAHAKATSASAEVKNLRRANPGPPNSAVKSAVFEDFEVVRLQRDRRLFTGS